MKSRQSKRSRCGGAGGLAVPAEAFLVFCRRLSLRSSSRLRSNTPRPLNVRIASSSCSRSAFFQKTAPCTMTGSGKFASLLFRARQSVVMETQSSSATAFCGMGSLRLNGVGRRAGARCRVSPSRAPARRRGRAALDALAVRGRQCGSQFVQLEWLQRRRRSGSMTCCLRHRLRPHSPRRR